jgi:hypothetical protein
MGTESVPETLESFNILTLLFTRERFIEFMNKDFLAFYDQIYNIFGNCLYTIQFWSLKMESTYTDFKEAVLVLNLKTSINVDE